MTNPTQLVFFEVTGNFNAVADPAVSGNVNTPVFQPVNALITFTPRLPRGEQFFVSNYLITPAYNAEQTIYLIGSPVFGTFTLSYGGHTSAPISYDASAAAVQSALRALPSIGAGNVIVTAGNSPLSYNVLFTQSLGSEVIPALSADAAGLSNVHGAGYCEVTVTVTATGSPQIVGDTAISLPPLTARIFEGVLSTIDYADTPGFNLVANTGLNFTEDLIYDVTFSNVTFNGSSRYLAPFAFVAPTSATTVSLTNPSLERMSYQAPIELSWSPSTTGYPMSTTSASWRQRATLRSA